MTEDSSAGASAATARTATPASASAYSAQGALTRNIASATPASGSTRRQGRVADRSKAHHNGDRASAPASPATSSSGERAATSSVTRGGQALAEHARVPGEQALHGRVTRDVLGRILER
jgi:hypothetical protein